MSMFLDWDSKQGAATVCSGRPNSFLIQILGFILSNSLIDCLIELFLLLFFFLKLLLYEATGDEKYAAKIRSHVEYVMNEMQKTPGGLTYRYEWGTCRHAANTALELLIVSHARFFTHHSRWPIEESSLIYFEPSCFFPRRTTLAWE